MPGVVETSFKSLHFIVDVYLTSQHIYYHLDDMEVTLLSCNYIIITTKNSMCVNHLDKSFLLG